MWNYIYTDEFYHHGIKGQKWGVRRDRLSEKIRAKESKRSKIAEEKGVTSKAYRKSSQNLYYLKGRHRIASAKANGDKQEAAAAKYDLRFAKDIKKHGTDGGMIYSKSIKKDVYGEHLSKKQIDKISELESKSFMRKYRVTTGAKIVASTLVSVGAVAVGKLVISNQLKNRG